MRTVWDWARRATEVRYEYIVSEAGSEDEDEEEEGSACEGGGREEEEEDEERWYLEDIAAQIS